MDVGIAYRSEAHRLSWFRLASILLVFAPGRDTFTAAGSWRSAHGSYNINLPLFLPKISSRVNKERIETIIAYGQ